MPTPETQRVKEIRQKLNKVYLRLAYGKSDIETAKKEVNEILTQDRHSLHTSLVEAVEGMKICGIAIQDIAKDTVGFIDISTRPEHIVHNQACDKFLTIINSIFKE